MDGGDATKDKGRTVLSTQAHGNAALDRRPTLKMIAEITGLGVTTVSRALKDAPDLAATTKARIRKVAKDIGYRPDRAGVRLRTGRTNVISLVLSPHDEILGYGTSVIFGMSRSLRNTPYHLIVTPHFLDADPMEPIRYIMETGSADGVIFSRTEPMDERVRFLLERDFPFVCHGRTELATPHPWYDYDNFAFAYEAARRLIEKGRRRLVLIRPPRAFTFHQHMIHGFMTAVSESGVFHQTVDDIDLGSPPERIRAFGRSVVRGEDQPDGFVCGGEVSAMALIAGLTDAGLEIGREVDLVAKQTSNLFDQVIPPVDSIYEDLQATGERLVSLLLRRIDNEPAESLQVLEKPALRYRSAHSV